MSLVVDCTDSTQEHAVIPSISVLPSTPTSDIGKFSIIIELTRVRGITRSVSARHGNVMGSMLGLTAS